jgi:hypothetical protein
MDDMENNEVMVESNFNDSLDCYNTAIKDIAGLKDYSLIFNIINTHFSEPSLTDSMIRDENEFDIRTTKTRTKVGWAINKSILQFISEDHRDLIRNVFQENVPLQDKKFAFLWHFCLNNRLFREITISVFAKVYFSGRAQISKEDIIAFIKDISSKNDPSKPNWSEDTIYRLATKYLSLMTKLDFVSAGRVKTFNHIRLSVDALVIFLYFANLFSPSEKNILDNEILPTSFIDTDDIQSKLKKLSMRGFFDMNFNGSALNIELAYSHKEICNALYN